ncbi:MAG: metalloprotease [Sandaracinaceae bacterium]
MFERGYWTAFHLRGIPIRFHWSLPILMLLLSGGRILPGVWLGFVLMILIHELGHALLVRTEGHHVHAVDVHGLGGVCRYSGHVTPRSRSWIAWGGVLGQALLIPVGLALMYLGPLRSPFVASLAYTWVYYNVFLIVLNLLPFPPFDGAEAWKLFGMSWGRAAPRSSKKPPRGFGLREKRTPGPYADRPGRSAKHQPGEKVSDLLDQVDEEERKRIEERTREALERARDDARDGWKN